MRFNGIARALSVIGHPALMMPVAVIGSAAGNHAPPQLLLAAAAAAVLVALSVGVYSAVQVRVGRWSHVDASVAQERSQLNIFLVLVLFGLAGVSWWGGQDRLLVLGLATAGSLVVFGHLLRARLKVSLHAAFAVFASTLLWPNVLAVSLGLALTAGVAWSRLVLRRHSPAEVVVGLLAGAAAGLGFRLLAVVAAA